ncbi:DUF3626 domain-containing protein [Kribbella antibiotica]|uniref:DUF3626 domain-containing protein n=1 Tax=Kribbella antibiotica TaxID=190195 RepID=A0A4R4ZP10_9ACTN|nr:DUF3626 domain-containing protein [Kribbella antibiotica]
MTLQFHPDWPYRGGMVIDSMVADGIYRSQFSTGSSNGGLTAHPGGDRWRWESRLFTGRYDDAPADTRPVYGAWNRHADPYGGAIRFGSSYLRLRPEVVDRATFCFPDSVYEPTDFGDQTALPHLCALADESELGDLDNAVEAHVHGSVRFSADVEAVVLDPSFAGTAVEAAAARLGCAVEYHPGFRVRAGAIDPAYRGPHIVALAESLGGLITPELVGRAARAAIRPAQDFKRLWHCLAHFGRAGTA